MSAEGLDMDAIRALAKVLDPDAFDPDHHKSKHHAAEMQWAVRRKMATDYAQRVLDAGYSHTDHVRALEQENAGLRGEVERLTVEADQAIAQADEWSGTAAVLERERDAARAALDGLRAAITVVIGPEGDEWRWSDSNLRERLRAVLGEHGGAEGLLAAPEGDSGGLRGVAADGPRADAATDGGMTR